MQELLLFFKFNLDIKLVAWAASVFVHHAWMARKIRKSSWVLALASLLIILMIADPLLSLLGKENDRIFVLSAYFLSGLFGAHFLMVIAPWLNASRQKDKSFFTKIINKL
jgi:hypothetical protein